MEDSLAVDAVNLTKRYGSLTAVDAITLQVSRGEIYGILGPNGAGKTTFLRMLFGLIRPDAGTIKLFGRTRGEVGAAALDGVAGFVESPRFYPYLSGRANLEILARLDGGCPPGRLDEVLAIVDLSNRARDRVGGYSFGMRQRLGVAASLLRDPRLLVLDEPANGLDPAGIRDMRALVKQLAASGLTVLLSSHDMLEVEEICDNVTIMNHGKVVFHGEIVELRQRVPAQGHELVTSDDMRVRELIARQSGMQLGADVEERLLVHGDQDALDALVATIVGSGISIRSLTTYDTPLESLFFMLTEQAHGTAADAPELSTAGGPA